MIIELREIQEKKTSAPEEGRVTSVGFGVFGLAWPLVEITSRQSQNKIRSMSANINMNDRKTYYETLLSIVQTKLLKYE